MNHHASLWEATAEQVRTGTSAALATVSRHRGSLPMASDAKMLVTTSGRRMGTVGGGCVEADVIEQAVATLDSQQPTFVRHSLNADAAGDLGLSCGGTVDFFVEPVPMTADMEILCSSVAGGVVERRQVSIITAIDWSQGPRKVAQIGDVRLTVGSDVPINKSVLESSRPSGASSYLLEEHACFVEHVCRNVRLIIYGAGHVGRKIASLAASVGFHVVVIDDREDFANVERLPDVHEVIVGDFSETVSAFDFDGDDYVLATTRGHSYDATIIQHVATTRAGYVGMLGSRRKKAVLWKALHQAGVPHAALDRVRCPIGIEIGADGPDEIAVSVVAELIAYRRQGDAAEK